MSSKRNVLVTGATGVQGRATIKALLAEAKEADNIQVIALTRNVDSPSAKSLASLANNVSLVQGNLDQAGDIFARIPSVDAVFSVQSGAAAVKGAEEAQGKALIDEAIKHGIKHFVYTSVDRHGDDSDTDSTNIPHFISKHAIEQHLIEASRATNMTWTILRPTAFMDNLTPDFAGKIFPTAWKIGLKPTTPLQLIATKDIGTFAALALLYPEEYKERKISLAGDALTFEQANTIFEKTFRKPIPVTYGFIASILLWLVKDLGLMFKWFDQIGYDASVDELRK
ncbi:hypothetical protein BZG36_05612, partial [Bifiguratus adelaidae]